METRPGIPRTRNREWGFFGTCARNGAADPEAAWDEAMEILSGTEAPGLGLEPEVARDLLDSPWGRHLADDAVGSELRDVLLGLRKHRRWVRQTLEITSAIVRARADRGEEDEK